MGEHAEVRTERRTLRMLFVVRGKRRVEIVLRCSELTDAQQRRAHRVDALRTGTMDPTRLRASASSEMARIPFRSPSMNRIVNATHSQRTGTWPRRQRATT